MSSWYRAITLPPPAVRKGDGAHLRSRVIAVGSSTQKPAARPSAPVGSSHAHRSRADSAERRGVLTAQSPQRSATRAVPPGAAIARLQYRESQKPGTVPGPGQTLPRRASSALQERVSEMGARGGSRTAEVTDPTA